jgi:hypothetical protein
MKIRYLLDENLSPRLKAALVRLQPQIDVLRIGDDDAPPLGIEDPAILLSLSTARRLLVTANRRTMSLHLKNHYISGGESHWGILWIRPNTSDREVILALHLIWETSEAEEWSDSTDYIPF